MNEGDYLHWPWQFNESVAAVAAAKPALESPADQHRRDDQQAGFAVERDFEKHRAEIIDLYINQRKTLSEVMWLMVERHSLRATARQYKRRFQKWGARKNRQRNKNVDALDIDPSNEDPADGDDEGDDFFVDETGLVVFGSFPIEELPVKPISSWQFGARSNDVFGERLVRCITEYIYGSFEKRTWVVDKATRIVISRVAGASSHEHMNEWDSHMLEVFYFFRNHQDDQGFKLLGMCLDKAAEIFREQDVELLSNLTWYIRLMQDTKQEVGANILAFFYRLSLELFGPCHPVTLFWQCFCCMGRELACQYVKLAMETMVDALQSATGGLTQASFSIHRRTIKFANRAEIISSADYQKRLNFLIQQGRVASKEQVLDESLIRAGIDLCFTHQADKNLREAKHQFYYVSDLLMENHHATAANANADAGDYYAGRRDVDWRRPRHHGPMKAPTESHHRGHPLSDEKIYNRLKYEWLFALVTQYNLEEDFVAALEFCRELVRFCETFYGLNDSKTVCAMEKLYRVLDQLGFPDEANQVRVAREERLMQPEISW